MSVSANRAPGAKLYAPPMPPSGDLLGGVSALMGGNSVSASASASPQYQTVGDYYAAQASQQRQTVGRVFEGIAELAPPVLLGQIAAIGISHEFQADQRVFSLPWDAQGRWKAQANQIHAQEAQAADQQIGNLPLISAVSSTGQVISEGATAVVNGTVAAGQAVYDTAATVGNVAVDAVNAAGQAVADAGKSVGRGLLGALAYTGQGMVNWANSQKKYFQ